MKKLKYVVFAGALSVTLLGKTHFQEAHSHVQVTTNHPDDVLNYVAKKYFSGSKDAAVRFSSSNPAKFKKYAAEFFAQHKARAQTPNTKTPLKPKDAKEIAFWEDKLSEAILSVRFADVHSYMKLRFFNGDNERAMNYLKRNAPLFTQAFVEYMEFVEANKKFHKIDPKSRTKFIEARKLIEHIRIVSRDYASKNSMSPEEGMRYIQNLKRR